MTYSVSDSEDEFDDWGKKDAPKRKAVISDDDTSFAPEPSAVADSDMDSPAPPRKEPAWVWDTRLNEESFFHFKAFSAYLQHIISLQEESDKEQISSKTSWIQVEL